MPDCESFKKPQAALNVLLHATSWTTTPTTVRIAFPNRAPVVLGRVLSSARSVVSQGQLPKSAILRRLESFVCQSRTCHIQGLSLVDSC